jgi:hypothetical protein
MDVTPSNDKVVGYRGQYLGVDFSSKEDSPSKIPIKEAIKTVYEPRKVINCGRQQSIAIERRVMERSVSLPWRRW